MYLLIGISLLFTFLLAVGLTAAGILSIAWRVLGIQLEAVRPRSRANIIFGLRVLPLVSAITVGLAFVVPSFLMFEPSNSGEKISLKLGVIIVIAAFGFAAAFYRVLGSWWRTHRLVADWSQRATPLNVGNVSIPAYKLKHDFPVFAVVGVIRPRLFIAEQ